VGLQIDTVSLSDHDPEWREIFEQEKEHLGGALGDEIAGIEHVGSTAVPGLKAKADFFDSRHSSISSPGEPKIRRAARLRKTGSAY
jgi:hypothetical protein